MDEKGIRSQTFAEEFSMKDTDNLNRPGLLEIFWIYFRVGALTIGGGLVMISIIRHELTRKGWIDDDTFVEEFTTATSIPGAIIVNFSLLHGYRMRGVGGVLISLLGVVLPSFIIMVLVAAFLFPYFDHAGFSGFLKGASAAVSAILAYTALTFGKSVLKGPLQVMLALCALILALLPQIHPVVALIAIGVVGNFLLVRRKNREETESSDG
ncbi:chromate transporter [Chitinispirillales bacterium ANBcel5]|uniref:chromate transporter n=1 Tax=Cellulosispirillum alkaliphilum TaxID=3039283 RepID=UPI002A56A5AB|nr:chromate transporter [Chitinispirillales bacterium ANBcel5]